ncbi:hypothetical protein CR513_49321, partial [Mucuna pruriens]
MAYVRLAPLAVFLLATSCINVFGEEDRSSDLFRCLFIVSDSTMRLNPIYPKGLGDASLTKMIDANPNLCQSNDECMKKGSGNFCARYPNPYVEYGWCFNSDSQELKDFFKRPVAIAK